MGSHSWLRPTAGNPTTHLACMSYLRPALHFRFRCPAHPRPSPAVVSQRLPGSDSLALSFPPRYYFPRMTPDETMLIKQWHSDGTVGGGARIVCWKTTHARPAPFLLEHSFGTPSSASPPPISPTSGTRMAQWEEVRCPTLPDLLPHLATPLPPAPPSLPAVARGWQSGQRCALLPPSPTACPPRPSTRFRAPALPTPPMAQALGLGWHLLCPQLPPQSHPWTFFNQLIFLPHPHPFKPTKPSPPPSPFLILAPHLLSPPSPYTPPSPTLPLFMTAFPVPQPCVLVFTH